MSSIKSDDEIDRLLNHKNNSLHKTGVQVKVIGKGNHGTGGSKPGTIPDRDKDNHASIAVTAELIGQKATSDLLGVAHATVNKYANGKNSDGKPDKEKEMAAIAKVLAEKMSAAALESGALIFGYSVKNPNQYGVG